MNFLSIAALVLLLPASARAELHNQQLLTMSAPKDLAETPAGPVEAGYQEILTAGVSASGAPDATLQIEAYVELYSNGPATAVCRLMPKGFLGRPVDPSQVTIEFGIAQARAQGSNPPPIVGTVNVTRRLQAKVPAGVGGAFYRLQCRRDLGNQPVRINYASLEMTLVAPMGTAPGTPVIRPPRQ